MNTDKDLLTRLLKLFPIKAVKEHFDLQGKWDEIIVEIFAKHPQKVIFDFVSANIDYTRQHVHICSLQRVFRSSSFDTEGFPLPILTAVNLNNECTIVALPVITFNVLVTKPYEETTVQFYQPIKVTLKNRHLIIQVTTLEKNLSHYFEGERKVVDSSREPHEEYNLSAIQYFVDSKGLDARKCDIHKGIKKLWEDEIIDCKYLKRKKSKSTDTTTMDENYTIKRDYPDEYEGMKDKPLLKTLFRYIGEKPEYFCEHFNADPMQGVLGIASFPENTSQIQNIVNDILEHN